MKLVEKFAEFGRRLRLLSVSHDRFERELADEMRLHRDLRAREMQSEGHSSDEAADAAQRRFGNTLRLQEQAHEASGWTWLENLVGDARYALRRLRNAPGFTAVAVITLALGIGANTAIYTLVHAIMLQSLPVTRPNELWNLGDDRNGGGGGGFMGDVTAYSYKEYLYLRDNTPEFSSVAAFQPGGQDINVRRPSSSGPPEHYMGELVSGNYFQTLGVTALIGPNAHALRRPAQQPRGCCHELSHLARSFRLGPQRCRPDFEYQGRPRDRGRHHSFRVLRRKPEHQPARFLAAAAHRFDHQRRGRPAQPLE